MPKALAGWDAMTNEQLFEPSAATVGRSRSPKSGGRFAKAGGQLGSDRRRAWNFPTGGLGALFLNPVTLEAQSRVARNRRSHCLDAISKKRTI